MAPSRTIRRTRRLAAAALAVPLVLSVAACGSDDESANTTSTTAPSAGGTTKEQGSGKDDAVLSEIEQRGKPTPAATEPATELQVTDDVVGTGAEVEPGDTVTVHYTGVSASTGKQFDSSWDRGEPIQFPLSGVIKGWGEGLVGMKVGGRRTLVIPPDMAYGNTPPPGAGIAPGETLVFTVDLVSVP